MFIPVYILITLAFGGGYVSAKAGVTPASVQSVVGSATAQTPTGK